MVEGSGLVSIIIPTYNRPAHVLLTLNSVLAQTYPRLEVIVQDNASEVDLTAAIEQLGDPRVRYFRNERNLGAVRNFALGFSRANGEFVGLVADDDLVDHRYVEKLLSPLRDHPDAIVAFCNFWVMDEADHVLLAKSESLARYFGTHVIPRGYHPDCELLSLQYRAIGIMSQALLRRSAADWAAPPADTSPHIGDLHYMYLMACTRRGCYYVAERLSYISHTESSLTTSLTATPEAWTVRARDLLSYWTMVHRDRRLANRRYYHLKRAHFAALLVFYLARTGRWREAAAEALAGMTSGLFLPRSVIEHVSFLMNIRRAGIQRKLP